MFFLQLMVAGISVGAVYALVGHGYNITFWSLRVVNFAHGSFLMMAVMLSLAAYKARLPLPLAMAAGLLAIGILGWCLERVAVRPLTRPGASSMGWIVSTLGAGIVLQAVATEIWGAQAMAFPPVLFVSTDYLRVGKIQLSLQLLLVFLAAVLAMAAFELFIRYTLAGKAIRATAVDPEAARTMGINTRRVISLSFVLSALLAGIAGLLVAPVTGVDPAFGLDLMIKGFVAAVLGGMGSSAGALAGGICLGLLELLVGGYISAGARNGVAFLLLILVLALRPQGLLGRKLVVKV